MLPCPGVLYCPAPTCNPKEGASFLPGCCLSPLSFPSRSRKLCHPGLCRSPPAFLFLAQELASSFPWPAALAPWPERSRQGRRQAEVRGPGCIPPLSRAVSSLGQGALGSAAGAGYGSSTPGSWVRGRQEGGKAGGLDTDHIPAVITSFDPYTYWEGGRDREASQRGGH